MTEAVSEEDLRGLRRTRIKICGITRPEDGWFVGILGADAIGLVFYPPSPRSVELDQAQAIVASLPPFVTVVGLFVNARQDFICRVLDAVRIDVLQFHGQEDPVTCAGFGLPYIKAIAIGKGIDVVAYEERYRSARALLLDSFVAGVAGGTGRAFDWSLIPVPVRTRVILAGGLTPANATQAILQVRPFAVDVSSGVESSKGKKDHSKLVEFFRSVHRADFSESTG
ncbi:MAG: phosphoribosylanthranilate isomerase [Gammaproteobacteria bacterium]|jgi:phosphoribosylanthranilate isomerase